MDPNSGEGYGDKPKSSCTAVVDFEVAIAELIEWMRINQ
jgi:hypothetical protein